MAKFIVTMPKDFSMQLSGLGERSGEAIKKAVYAGANIVADEMRKRLEGLPEDVFRHLKKNETFTGVPTNQKEDLIHSFGVTSILRDKYGIWNAKIGFAGYGRYKTKKYPKGLPNALLARSIESGSSVRRKIPFIRPAVNAVRKRTIAEMQRVLTEEFNKT